MHLSGRSGAKKLEREQVTFGSVLLVGALLGALLDPGFGLNFRATKPGSFFGTVLVDDFLASLFVSSLVGTVISLFPLRFLPGHKLRAWHKGAWAVTFGVSLFVLVQVLLRPHSTSSGPLDAPLVTTVLLFVLFGVGSLAFRDHFARKHRLERALVTKAAISELGEAAGAVATAVANPGPDGAPA
jgi:hypothetical protein